jgi:hypothetical protein
VGSSSSRQAGEHRGTDDGDSARIRLGYATGGEACGAGNVGSAGVARGLGTCRRTRLGAACLAASCAAFARNRFSCCARTDMGSGFGPGRPSRRQRADVGRACSTTCFVPGAGVGHAGRTGRSASGSIRCANVGRATGGAARVGCTAAGSRAFAGPGARARSYGPFLESSGCAFVGGSPSRRRHTSLGCPRCNGLGRPRAGRVTLLTSHRCAIVGRVCPARLASSAVGVVWIFCSRMGHSEDRGAGRTACAVVERAAGRSSRAGLGHACRAAGGRNTGSRVRAGAAAVERGACTGMGGARTGGTTVDGR